MFEKKATMSILAKKNFLITSLLISLAVLLGLIAGCSDCDRDSHNKVDTTSVDVLVGISGETTLAKSYSMPASTYYLECYLVENNDAVYDTVFGPEPSGQKIQAYQRLADGTVIMPNDIAAEDAIKIDSVMIEAYDQEGEFLGLLSAEGIEVQAGKTNTIDLTADDAPEFQSAEDLAKRTTLVVSTEPADQEGLVTIAVGETITATVMTTVQVSETITRDVYLAPDEYTMTTDSEALSIEANKVTGVTATTSPAEISVTAHTPTTITASFKVEVVEE